MFIFDIDGTIADATHRLHHIIGDNKDWEAYDKLCHEDIPIKSIITIANCLYYNDFDIMLLTGRNERTRKDTEAWLQHNHVRYDFLIMRGFDDRREDTIVKLENLAKFREDCPEFKIQTIFEDRKRLTEAFRAEGYHVCQVAEGDF